MKTFNILFVATAVLFLAACSDDDLMQKPIDDGDTVMSLDDDVSILPTGGQFSLAFTANSRWSIVDKPEWLDVNRNQGPKGTTMLTFSAGVNDTRKDRTASMKFVAKDGSFSRDFVVRQAYPYLRIDADSLSFDWNNGRTEREGVEMNTNTAKISVSSNVGWEFEELSATKAATIDMTDFAISTLSGENDSEVEFIPLKDNYGKEPCDIQVRLFPVMSDGKGGKIVLPEKAVDRYVIKLHQKNLRFLINDSPDKANIEFSELNDDKNINFIIDSEIPWKVSSCPEWIVMDKKTDKKTGKDVSTVNFQADGANPEKAVRTGSIRLSTDAGAYRDIDVSQRAYVFDIDQSSFDIGNDDTAGRTVHLNTTGSWEVSDIPSWLSVSPSEGMGAADIVVAAKGQNLTFADYSKVMTVKSTMNALQESVHVSQSRFVFDVLPDSQLSDLPTMNTSKFGVSIESSGRWSVSGIPDWIDVDIVDAEKGKCSINVGANCGNPDLSVDRTATLVVTSLNHKDAGQDETRSFTVKQRKYTFEVSENDFGLNPAYSPSSKTATVKCSADWEIESCPTWVSPDVTSGDGRSDAVITFQIGDNLVKTARDEDVVIKSLYNNERKSIRVAQDAFVFDNSDQSFDVPVMNVTGFTVDFDLTDKAPWRINSGYDGWLNPSVSSGFGHSAVTFTPAPNPNLTERTGTAVIYSPANAERKTITFKQEKYVFDDSAETHSFTELETTSVPLNIICSGPWTIKDKPSWVDLSKTYGIAGETINFNPSKNTSLSERSARFLVVSTINNLEKAVSVHQDAFEFNSEPESFSYGTLEERSDVVSVLCSGKWVVDDVPSWVVLSTCSGDGSEAGIVDELTIRSRKNLTESELSGTMRIKSVDAGYVKNITLNQAKFDFRVDNDKFAYSSPLDVTSNVVNVVCPADWSAKSSADWLHLNSAESSSDGSFSLNPDVNLTLEDRTAVVTVTSALNQLKREISVTQPKFIFNVGRSSITGGSPLASSCGTVDVQCSGGWTADTESDWISLVKEIGGFTVSLAMNPNTEKRTGEILVKSSLSGHVIPISVTQAAYVFDNESQNVFLDACPVTASRQSVICSGAWTAKSSQDWLRMTPAAGSGDGTISITADNNPSPADRTATVTVTCSDNTELRKVFSVTQKGHVLDVDKSEVNIEPYDAGMRSAVVSVATSGPWSVSSSASWLKVSQDVASGNGAVTLTADMNISASERMATVTVKCSNTLLSKSITVTQRGYVFDSASCEVMLDACPVTASRQAVTCSGAWSARSSQTWLKVSPTSGIGNGNISITADINQLQTDRSATITVTSSDNASFSKVFTVVQKGHVFTVEESDVNFEPYEENRRSTAVAVKASGPWKVSSSASWLKVSQNVTAGDGVVTLTAEVNTAASARSATAVVKCSNTSLSRSITVNQGGYVFSIAETSHTLSDPLDVTPFSIAVDCSGTWTAETAADWLTLKMTASTLIVVPVANMTADARSAAIVFNSAGHSLTCIVSQNAGALK